MEGMDWVVRINDELKSTDPSLSAMEQWKKHSIYKIPACITDLNKKAYSPQTVSFGPYHHEDRHLAAMEEHKHRALLQFLKRCGKPIEVLVQRMGEVAQDLRDSYKPLDSKWKEDSERFLRMMILDGVFMVEILRTVDGIPSDYDPQDPVFSEHGKLSIMPYIRRDMLMLENQLPMMVLHTLLAVEGNYDQDEEELNKLILRFFSVTPTRKMGKCLHILHVYRKSLLPEEFTPQRPLCSAAKFQSDDIMRSATELTEAGIWFIRSQTEMLTDVTFRGGVLSLPPVVVDDTTEPTLLNLMAFERLHVGAGNEVTSYVFFMDNIIDNERDVAILHTRGIIKNAIGSDKAVAKLFNSLSKDIAVDRQGTLDEVQVCVVAYCRKPWNRWRANLIQTYFRNPWSIISLMGAIVLFLLTVIQTWYTVHQSSGSGDSNSSSPPKPPKLAPRKWM